VREGLRVNGDRVEMMPGERRLLIRPIKWFYEE
jgi:virulence-associated protein VagC